MHDHTMKFMKTAALLTKMAERDTRDGWEENGAMTTHDRALHHAREILERENTAVFSPEIDARIRIEFDELVAGDLKLPEGWDRERLSSSGTVKAKRRIRQDYSHK